jgi:formate C-acetyltransferase
VNNVFDTQGHLVMGHKNILKWGFEGIKKRLREKLSEINDALNSNESVEDSSTLHNGGVQMAEQESVSPVIESWTIEKDFQTRFSKENEVTPDNQAFIEASIICCDAAINFIKRFGRFTEEEAKNTSDNIRKSELEEIAKICDWISSNTPRSFREALQLVWFNHVIAMISHGIAGILAVGRPDQYLYPYYKADLDAGKITDEEVTELFEEFLIKLSYNLLMLPSYGKATASELGGDGAAITVGGVDADGNDATNQLSYLFMDATENVKSMTNSFSIRISPKNNPREWIERAIEVYMKTSGPALFNDEVIIPTLQKVGVSLEDARDYALIGCVEPTSQGNTFGTTSGNDISLVGLLEMVLTNGMIRVMGKKYGIETGDPKKFASYEEIWDAYLKQMKHMISHMIKWVNAKDKIYAENYPNPFISMTMDGCIENALDMTQGGAKYNFSSISGRGLATVANSLCALKKIVFEDKSLTMKDFIKILNKHFKKKEEFRLSLRNKLPKFGNDDNYVDSIALDVFNAFCDEVTNYSCLRRPGIYRPSFFSYGLFILDGFLLGVTPDGRAIKEPVSNSLSPVNNTEKNGPTAVIKSITKLDHIKISNGMALNMRLLPLMLESSEKRSKIVDLVLTYFKLGGMEIQFNVVKQEDLIAAQIRPEQYQDLVIRVSGYSAYFIDVGKPVQDDIIARYEFDRI